MCLVPWNHFFSFNVASTDHIFCMNSLRDVCSFPLSRLHMRPSCPPLFSFPFFLALHFWSMSLTSTLSADLTVTKSVFCMPFKIQFVWGSAGDDVRGAVVLRAGREGHKYHVGDWGMVCTVEHTMCTCYLLVIFVLSTPELVKKNTYFMLSKQRWKLLRGVILSVKKFVSCLE